MTVDAYRTTNADRERAQRECSHRPDLSTIEADDHDEFEKTTLYIAECAICFASLSSGYIDGEPESAEWEAPEWNWR